MSYQPCTMSCVTSIADHVPARFTGGPADGRTLPVPVLDIAGQRCAPARVTAGGDCYQLALRPVDDGDGLVLEYRHVD